jgi:hypothetical protein
MDTLQALIVAARELRRRIVTLEVQGDINHQKETLQRLAEVREAERRISRLIKACGE